MPLTLGLTAAALAGDDPILAWRQRTLELLLRVMAVAVIPLLLLDVVNQLNLQRWPLLLWDLIVAMLFLGLTLGRGLGYRLRSALLVGVFLVGGIVGLRFLGLYGVVGAMPLISVALSVLLIGPRAGLAVAIVSVAATAGLLAAFSLGAIPYPQGASSYATRPQVMVNNWLMIAGAAALVGLMVNSLMAALRASLGATREANAELEATVERLTAEREVAQQLRYAEALARCSRALLVSGSSGAAAQGAIAAALGAVREAVGGDRIVIARYSDVGAGEEQMRRTYRLVGAVEREGLAPQRPPSPEEMRDLPPALDVWRRGGGSFNGPVAGQFPGHPFFQRYSDDNGVRSAFVQSLSAGGRWWGHIIVTDHSSLRSWDAGAVQLLQTAAEMVITFVSGCEAAQALQEREALLRSISDTLPDAFLYQLVQHDSGRYERFTYVSQTIERLLGVGADAVLADPAAMPPVHEADRGSFSAADIESLRSRGLFDVQVRLRKAGGRLGWFHIRSIPMQELGDGLTLWNGLTLEISGRKEAELALAEQLRYAEALARCSQVLLVDGAAAADWSDAVRQALAALREAVGCKRISLNLYRSPDEILDMPSIAIVDQDPAAPPNRDIQIAISDVPDTLMEALAAGGVVIGTAAQLFPEGTRARRYLDLNELRSLLFMSFHVSGLWRGHLAASDGDGQWAWSEPRVALLRTGLGMIAACMHQWETTATLRTREGLLDAARDRAEAAARASSAFLASMSHEIRTPLNAVIGMAALLTQTNLSDEQRELADTIATGGQALLAVINNILDFSRIEAGHTELDVAPFDLPECLSSAAELIAYETRRKGLALTCAVGPGVPHAVIGDAAKLRQVLLNLLGNAVKFTTQGEIALCAEAAPQDDGFALLSVAVRDTGIGIAPAELARIFEPFAQADSSTARRYGGTGLGLAISRQLIGLMGGTIEVSSAPGAGSTFTVTVPLPLAPDGTPLSGAAPAAATGRALRVLVVEDNPLNQEVTRRLVAHLGHAVTVVADGEAGVEAVARGGYDVVLMDVQLPGMDGLDVTRAIRALGPGRAQPRIIALTASALAGDRERFQHAGMDGYLSKPLQPAELERALAEALGGTDAPPRPGDAREAPLVEWQIVEQLVASLGPDGGGVALGLLEDLIPPQLGAIDAALASGDAGRLRAEAHQLRGGCLQLGAQAMAEHCRRLEHPAAGDDLPAIAAELHACFAATRRLLRGRYAPA